MLACLIRFDLDGEMVLQIILKDFLVAIGKFEVPVLVGCEDHFDDKTGI